MKKTIILLSISFAIIITCIIFYTSNHSETKTTQVDLLDMNSYRAFVIPVEIDGITYPFLWDTGSSRTHIKNELFTQLGLDTFARRKKYVITTTTDVLKSNLLEKLYSISIGDIQTEIFMLSDTEVDEFSNSFEIRRKDYNTYGVIGQDVISKYNWLFDFGNSKITISDREIKIPTKSSDDVLEWDFLYTKDVKPGIPLVNLSIASSEKLEPFYFDTGFDVPTAISINDSINNTSSLEGKHPGFKIDNNYAFYYPDLALQDSLFYEITESNGLFYTQKNLVINEKDFEWINIIKNETKPLISNYITAKCQA